MLTTLEIFGLPEKYMDGNGHFPNWGKEKKDDKAAAARKRAIASKMKNKKQNTAMEKVRKAKGLDNKKKEEEKPTHFDLAPFLQAFKRFLSCNADSRSKLRLTLKSEMETVKKAFVDLYGEPSFKKCVNIQEFGKILSKKGIILDTKIVDCLGPLFICFGDISYELELTERMPEETEEERRAA